MKTAKSFLLLLIILISARQTAFADDYSQFHFEVYESEQSGESSEHDAKDDNNIDSADFANMPTTIRVGITDRFNNRTTINVDNNSITYGNVDENGRYSVLGALQSATGFTIRGYSQTHVSIYAGGQRLQIVENTLRIQDTGGGFISLEGIEFRGVIEFARSGGSITAVNYLDIEEYLFGVVPAEMPPSWHLEALKSQAVAARTYTLYILKHGSTHANYDLCNTVHCQVYRGVGAEVESTNTAVLETAGLALFFDGELIESVYFASSGGSTEDSENVWVETRPYLRSALDPHEYNPVMWARTFTFAELTNLLTRSNRSIGTATDVTIGSTHHSGRVEALNIHGTGGTVTLTKEEIRTFFGPSSGGSLQSRNFIVGGVIIPQVNVAITDGEQDLSLTPTGLHGISVHGVAVPVDLLVAYNGTAMMVYDVVDTIIAAPSAPGTITLTGSGFGHGVGLSQRGAQGMAIRGYSFMDILSHFYYGVSIR
jgi:stage II sporulation protein D